MCIHLYIHRPIINIYNKTTSTHTICAAIHIQMSNLVKQKREITCHLHQVVDLLVCQLLNLRMKQHLVTVHSQTVNKPYLYSPSFQNRDEKRFTVSKSIIQAYTQ